MVDKTRTKAWDLSPGQTVELDDARGTRLRVARGVLWVTMERDGRDIVLHPGDRFVIDRNGVTLVEAQGRAVVCVAPAHAVPHCPPAVAAWTATLAAWLLRAYRRAGSRRRCVPYL